MAEVSEEYKGLVSPGTIRAASWAAIYLVKSELAGSSTFALAFSSKLFTSWKPSGGFTEEKQRSLRIQGYIHPFLCLPCPSCR